MSSRNWSATYNKATNNGVDYVASITDVSMVCGFCGILAHFQTKFEYAEYLRGSVAVHLLLQCSNGNCQRYSFARVEAKREIGKLIGFRLAFITPILGIDNLHPGVPDFLADDWKEVQQCVGIGAVKATAVMCRRVLYDCILDQGCKEHPLREGLQQLIDKCRLPRIFDEWLAAIKDDGHDAAHPHRSLEISAENVAETVEYTSELIRLVYIEPWEFEQRKARAKSTGI